MGKGDRRSRRGKLRHGTFGKTRPKHGGKHHHHVLPAEPVSHKRRGRS